MREIISIWHDFIRPPWGGGNQFLLALKNKMLTNGINLQENFIDNNTTSCLNSALSFNISSFKQYYKKYKPKVVHRVDGPVILIRGFDKEKDDLCFSLNNEFASATVVQSRWMLDKIHDLGYKPVNPAIIYNASDSRIFNRSNKINFLLKRKTRLISTSWSDNVRKGKDVYLWLDKNLDWNKFEYTFVGNVDALFKNIKKINPIDSFSLAKVLKQHDVFITASKNDPCSNSLIEALSCGLPAIYLNDGGHPEIVKTGGLPFENPEEILLQLTKIVNNYDTFQKSIQVENIESVYNKYMEMLKI